MIKGSVKVTKVFEDGTEELVVEDNNISTAGLGYALSNMLTGEANEQVGDFQIE